MHPTQKNQTIAIAEIGANFAVFTEVVAALVDAKKRLHALESTKLKDDIRFESIVLPYHQHAGQPWDIETLKKLFLCDISLHANHHIMAIGKFNWVEIFNKPIGQVDLYQPSTTEFKKLVEGDFEGERPKYPRGEGDWTYEQLLEPAGDCGGPNGCQAKNSVFWNGFNKIVQCHVCGTPEGGFKHADDLPAEFPLKVEHTINLEPPRETWDTTGKYPESFDGHLVGIKRNNNGLAESRSVLQDWVMKLPLRMQGTMLTAIRGCDNVPKYPLDSVERCFTAYVRFCVMVAFDAREIDSEVGCFMQSKLPEKWKSSAWDNYPHHYLMHLLHALQIIGIYHPSEEIRLDSIHAYHKMIDGMHLVPEKASAMISRLTEDRFATGEIVK